MALAGTVPERQVRALFSARTVTVYQAYRPEIANRALAAGTFVPPFRLGRMTWIKPSFLWMMYRSGWAAKPGQERVLAISQQQWAEKKLASPVRIQWDPERSLLLQPLPWRSIQIGLSGEAAARYVREWITSITDATPLAERINRHVSSGDLAAARAEMPAERVYPLPPSIRTRIGASPALPVAQAPLARACIRSGLRAPLYR